MEKKKGSEKSPGDTGSSGSISSHSERYSGEQDTLKEYSNHFLQPEDTSKMAAPNGEFDDYIQILTEKLSAALVNVGVKEDLVKQHAKVADEAIAGWEKAENEVAILKQQLEAAVQKNLGLEVKVNHLDGALKECVRQLRQVREEQEQRINEALAEKTNEWETTRVSLESELLGLRNQTEELKAKIPVHTDLGVHIRLESIVKENAVLKLELTYLSQELDIRTIERDLSIQAAETASKQQLENIKKVAKLEAECRRLQSELRKSSLVNEHKSPAASSLSVESLADSQSDSSEQIKNFEVDIFKMKGIDAYGGELKRSDSWAMSESTSTKNQTSCSFDMDIMDDFLEMERLAALPEAKNKICAIGSEFVACQANTSESSLRAELKATSQRVTELETNLQQIEAEKNCIACRATDIENTLRAELDTMSQRVGVLNDKLEKIEAEKAELENALIVSTQSVEAANTQLIITENKLKELQKELTMFNESKNLLECELVGMEVETRTMSKELCTSELDAEKEQTLSAELVAKCQEMENEPTIRTQEAEVYQTTNLDGELTAKQEDVAAAADKLAECQKTIASLGRQLKSLPTLEDFLTDTPIVLGTIGGGI
ncbi:filament-like plant protein [Daucus carota subsp. sativus]|uniref:Filament-like plant protein n=1 Tax=Daucus carota subsp. sativus TaxID=79200 RepID=A0A164XPJ5_DAUCS|nr:PREDICTED: filament-like plant protein [Daucus carota subsp. sativus]XP_017249580.1 PREDICTED: filament-like plant protein [Daucus carota subsp. sativus]